MKPIRKRDFLVAAFVGALSFTNAVAQTSSQPADSWKFSVEPYLWFPNVKSTAQFTLPSGVGGGTATVEKGADDYLSNLELAAMVTVEARRGRWAIFSDLIYLDFGDDNAAVRTVTGPGGNVQVPVNTATQSSLKGGVWELAASYAVSQSNTSAFEVLGGVRYLKLEARVDWQLAGPVGMFPQAGSVKQKVDIWDAIVGVRGRAKLGEGNWFAPWYLDVGAGDSKLTWQALAGIGYTFKWGDLLLAYRHLEYEQDSGKLVQDMSFSGPALGATFRF